MMRWKNGRIFTSKTLRGEHVGLEEIDDGIWSVDFGPVLLARFDEREMKFHGWSTHLDRRQSTPRRQRITCVIEDPPSCRQRASSRIESVLTLRKIGRSAPQGSPVVRANERRKV